MKTFYAALFSAILLLFSIFSVAQTPNSIPGTEIEQLLLYVGNSNCQFNRNGSWYSAIQTKKHFNSKYIDLLDKRSMVLTAEDFIQIVATHGSTSSKPYLVKCDGSVERESAVWLSTELARLRKEAK